MNTPPTAKLRRLSLPKRTAILQTDNETVISSNFRDTEDSPTYLPNTQESIDGIDVGWDWNSPQSTQRKYKKPRKCLIQSPQLTIKHCTTIAQQQSTQLEKLHEELKALQQQLAQPDDEDCLCVSPQQEQEFKSIVLDNDNDRIFTEFDDIFNDSIEEQLLLCSQKAETIIINTDNQQQQQQKQKTDVCNNSINNLLQQEFNDGCGKWDDVFNSIENKQTKDNVRIKNTFQQRTRSEDTTFKQQQQTTTTSDKTGFQRTKSFEFSQQNVIVQTSSSSTPTLSRAVLDEIERKRREAQLKLDNKRKQESNKCTDKEIERKRQEAKAKLEAKRLQEIIERNRQEALKRLQMNRQRNVTTQLKRL